MPNKPKDYTAKLANAVSASNSMKTHHILYVTP